MDVHGLHGLEDPEVAREEAIRRVICLPTRLLLEIGLARVRASSWIELRPGWL